MNEKEIVYLIWSFEHSAYWKQGRHGYTPIKDDAGWFGLEEAVDIVTEANMHSGRCPKESIVPILICAHCRDTGVVETDETDSIGHVHSGVGTQKCVCRVDS